MEASETIAAAERDPERCAFRYQRYYRRWLGGLPCLLLGVGTAWLLRNAFSSGIVFVVVCAMIMVALLSLYYCVTNGMTWYLATGSYWVDGGDVCLDLDGKEYRLHDVQEIFGAELSFLLNHCAKLSIETENETLSLFSIPLGDEEGFAECSVYPIFRAVVANSRDLEPVSVLGQEMDDWYRKKQ